MKSQVFPGFQPKLSNSKIPGFVAAMHITSIAPFEPSVYDQCVYAINSLIISKIRAHLYQIVNKPRYHRRLKFIAKIQLDTRKRNAKAKFL